MRRSADEQRIKHRSQGINIPADVRHGFQVRLLGRHIEQRAERRLLLVREARLPKIGQSGLMVLVEQNIRRLEVAVDDAFAVGMGQADGDVLKQLYRLGHGERAVATQ
jgi:hypothetical protein